MAFRRSDFLTASLLLILAGSSVIGCAPSEPPPPPPPLALTETITPSGFRIVSSNVGIRKYGGFLGGSLEIGLIILSGPESDAPPSLLLGVKADDLGGKKWTNQPLEFIADGRASSFAFSSSGITARRNLKPRIGVGRWHLGWIDVSDQLEFIRAVADSQQSSVRLARYYGENGNFNLESYELDERQRVAFGLVLEEFVASYPKEVGIDIEQEVAKALREQEEAVAARAKTPQRAKRLIRTVTRKHSTLMSNCEGGELVGSGDSAAMLAMADMAREDGISTAQYSCAIAIKELCDDPGAPFSSRKDRVDLGQLFLFPEMARVPMRIRMGSVGIIMGALQRAVEELNSSVEVKSEEVIRAELLAQATAARNESSKRGIEDSSLLSSHGFVSYR